MDGCYQKKIKLKDRWRLIVGNMRIRPLECVHCDDSYGVYSKSMFDVSVSIEMDLTVLWVSE